MASLYAFNNIKYIYIIKKNNPFLEFLYLKYDKTKSKRYNRYAIKVKGKESRYILFKKHPAREKAWEK